MEVAKRVQSKLPMLNILKRKNIFLIENFVLNKNKFDHNVIASSVKELIKKEGIK